MRTSLARALLCGSLLLASSGLAFNQENSRQETQKQEAPEENSQMTWKLINTGLFAIAFGYLLWKSAPRFFNARSADIQRAMDGWAIDNDEDASPATFKNAARGLLAALQARNGKNP